MESSVTPKNPDTETKVTVPGEPAGSVSPPASPSGDTPPVKEFAYSHPLLKGKSPEEIERVFKLQEQTTRSQGSQLTQLTADIREIKDRPVTPPPVAEPEPTSKDFYDDPIKTMTQMLHQAVEPLRAEIATARSDIRADTGRASLKAKYDDWDLIEPGIDELLSMQKFPDPNDPGLLESLYYTAKGMMVHKGMLPTRTDPTPPPTVEGAPPAPPQHRASTPPAPPRQEATPGADLRDLTEEEKRLAGEYGMTKEEFLKWQGMDQFEVPTADFDKEQK